MTYLKFRRINVIAPRLTEITQNKKRKESEIESEKRCKCGEFSPKFWIQTAGDFWPPVVQTSHESGYHSANHDVMEMGDDEIRVVHVHIDRQRSEKESSETADDKQSDKTECV